MKTSITAVIAMTTALVSAAPSPAPAATAALPLEALFKRQTECAAINGELRQPASQPAAVFPFFPLCFPLFYEKKKKKKHVKILM